MYGRLTEYNGESHIARNYATQKQYHGFRLLDVDAGQILCRQGEPAFEMHLLLSGFAQSKFTNSNGRESSTGLYFPSSLLGRGVCSSIDVSIDTLEILSPGQVVAIHRPEVQKLLQDPLAMAELSIAGTNDAHNLRRLFLIRGQETLVESIGQLMFMLTKDGQDESPRVTQNQLAGFINGQRARVSTHLGELVDQGYIIRANGTTKGSYRVTDKGNRFFSSELES